MTDSKGRQVMVYAMDNPHAKGMRWESPRGMMSIDPETRDIVQPIYIRRVEKLNGELWNTEFAKFDDVKDPLKVKK